ncbi:MAG: hypothetical protein ACREYA_15865 [Cupriavidus necator]
MTPERAARSLATFLLDLGFSETYLFEWLHTQSDGIGTDQDLAELCTHAHAAFMSNGGSHFRLLFIFNKPLPNHVGLPDHWYNNSRAVATWLRANDFSTEGVRAPAGITIEV